MAIFYLFVAFLLAPKIDLIPFGGASLRAEDFIWLAAMVVFFYKAGWRTLRPIPTYFLLFFVYLALSVFAFILNMGDAGIGGAFYILRQVQYMSWGILALSIAPVISRERFLKGIQITSWILVVWGVLEVAQLIPKIGKFATASERLTINTTGPFETSVVLLILAFAAQGYALRGALLVMTLLTQARITIMAGMVAFIVSRPRFAPLVIVAGCATLVLMPILSPLVQNTRFSETQSISQMAQTLEQRWRSAPIIRNQQEYMESTGFVASSRTEFWQKFASSRGDLSFQIRAQKWSVILKNWLAHPLQFVFGYSPGYFGSAVDSSLIRLVGESGLAGTIAFLAFLGAMLTRFRPSTLTWPTVLALIITASFIDIFWTSKAMSLLWFVSSWEIATGLTLAAGASAATRAPSSRRPLVRRGRGYELPGAAPARLPQR